MAMNTLVGLLEERSSGCYLAPRCHGNRNPTVTLLIPRSHNEERKGGSILPEGVSEQFDSVG
ncbi:hypothetical protein EYF80_065002 [Liparis tanakae]|uniref:Uncharacterized protein n=1 Tax=Liparis tanakae TaxID=230148 RepID=A0A4Z2E879_9TELE|nr:hypothetical protein EYF80_065002 [Liparis tanakae]